jgi:hypothetical protein
VYADSARLAVERHLVDAPEDEQRHALLGLALAYVGRGQRPYGRGSVAMALMPTPKDAQIGPYIQHQLVRNYLLVGGAGAGAGPARAAPQDPVLHYLSPGWLRVDDPLRSHPRFQRLLEGKM